MLITEGSIRSRVYTFLLGAGAVGLMTAASVFAAPPIAGEVANIEGRVLARNPAKGTPVRSLKPGDSIYQGEIINTGSSARIKILMKDKSILDLGPTSMFKVDEFELNKKDYAHRKVKMTMGYGQVRALVNKKLKGSGKFTIRTRAATMGVRGTEFVVLSDLSGVGDSESGNRSSATKVTVLEGKVAVKTPSKEQKANLVKPGEQLETKVVEKKSKDGSRRPAQVVSEAPQVKKLSKTEVQAVKQIAVVKDNTFKHEVVIDSSNAKSGGGAETLAMAFEEMPEIKLDGELDTCVVGCLPTDTVLVPMSLVPPAYGSSPQVRVNFIK